LFSGAFDLNLRIIALSLPQKAMWQYIGQNVFQRSLLFDFFWFDFSQKHNFYAAEQTVRIHAESHTAAYYHADCQGDAPHSP
jgi:hypothetical protein